MILLHTELEENKNYGYATMKREFAEFRITLYELDAITKDPLFTHLGKMYHCVICGSDLYEDAGYCVAERVWLVNK